MITIREQFEIVWKGSEISDDDTLKQIAWAFWQASREAVKVELPELFEDDRHAVTEAIRAAGINVK